MNFLKKRHYLKTKLIAIALLLFSLGLVAMPVSHYIKTSYALMSWEMLYEGGLQTSDITKLKALTKDIADDYSPSGSGKLYSTLKGNANTVKAWEVLQDVGSNLRTNVPALTKLVDDIEVNPALANFLRNNPTKKDAWELIHKSLYSHDINVLNYVDEIKSAARVGNASSTNYTQTFFNAFPGINLQGNGFVVHHAIEQQVFTKYPGLLTEAEINSLQNLRGISGEINGALHLSDIRISWNNFYNQFPAGVIPSRTQVLQKATEIDNLFGNLFTPPIRSL